jgi:hypothetical protein
MIKNWYLHQLLSARKQGALKGSVEPWPCVYLCTVVKDFVYEGRPVFARRFSWATPEKKGEDVLADVLELNDPAKVKELMKAGFISALPHADRYRIGEYPAWIPWTPPKDLPTDSQGKPDSSFDDCLVRIAVAGSVGGTQLFPGVILYPGEFVYVPFGHVRSSSYRVDGEVGCGTYTIFLEEPNPIKIGAASL